MKKIYTELSRIQRELKAPKNLYNKFGEYYYRNAEGILEAVKPLLNGLVLIINDEPVMVGARYYIKATVTLTDGDESISVVAYAREDEEKKKMDGCQLTGACSSYARKYALNALLMIDDAKDSDDDSLSPRNPANQENEIKRDAPANVEKANKIPAPAVAEKADNPTKPEQKKNVQVKAYLLKAMKELREEREISVAQNNKLFGEQFDALVSAKLAPAKNLEDYTMQEAQSLIEAMRTNFSCTGTELIKNGRKPS